MFKFQFRDNEEYIDLTSSTTTTTAQKRPRDESSSDDGGGQVYLVEERETSGEATGLYKIGKATSSESRLKSLRAGNPRQLVAIYSIFVEAPFDAESRLHRTFERQRLVVSNGGTEWFRFSDAGTAAKTAFKQEQQRQEQLAPSSSPITQAKFVSQSEMRIAAMLAGRSQPQTWKAPQFNDHVGASAAARAPPTSLTIAQREIERHRSLTQMTFSHWCELVTTDQLTRYSKCRCHFALWLRLHYDVTVPVVRTWESGLLAPDSPTYDALIDATRRLADFAWPRFCDILPPELRTLIASKLRLGVRQRETLGW